MLKNRLAKFTTSWTKPVSLHHRRSNLGFSPVMMNGHTFNKAQCIERIPGDNFTPEPKLNMLHKMLDKWSDHSIVPRSDVFLQLWFVFTKVRLEQKCNIADLSESELSNQPLLNLINFKPFTRSCGGRLNSSRLGAFLTETMLQDYPYLLAYHYFHGKYSFRRQPSVIPVQNFIARILKNSCIAFIFSVFQM